MKRSGREQEVKQIPPPKVREQRGEYSSLWATIEFTVTDFLERAIPWDVAAQPAPDFEVDQRVNW